MLEVLNLRSGIGKNLFFSCCSSFIMPPTLKKLEGHIAFSLSVCVCVCASVIF